MSQTGAGRGVRIFVMVWLGHLFSLFGSGVSTFALGIWVYQQTGSVTQYALLSTTAVLPAIVFLPLAGVLIDRWDRRMVMALGDLAAGLSQLILAVLYAAGALKIWHIYVAILITSTASAFQWTAFSATVVLLVPRRHLGRANGMLQMAEAIARIVAPALGGAVVGMFPLSLMLYLDAVTFLVSFSALLLVRFPRPEASGSADPRTAIWRDATAGWQYIAARPGLLALLALFAMVNFNIGIITVLVTPLVLAFTTPAMLGSILSVSGVGLFAGGVLLSIWGGPQRRVHAILGFQLLIVLSLILLGLFPSVPIFFVAGFGCFLSVPFIAGANQAIWQVKVAAEIQGRVFAIRRVIAWSTLPLAYLVAGPLADGVFEPLLQPGGLLADSVGRMIGVGPGYGIALLFLMLGLILLVVTIGSYAYPRLRLAEDELPDALIPDMSRGDEAALSEAYGVAASA
jgi:MFS family permease